MMKSYEIFFQDGNMTREKWDQLLHIVSKYHGVFHAWYLSLQIVEDHVHYYILTKYELPSFLDGLPFLCFKEQQGIVFSSTQNRLFPLIWDDTSFLDIYDQYLFQKKKKIVAVSFCFYPGREEKLWHSCFCYYEQGSNLWKTRVLLFSISTFLTFDMVGTNRFLFSKIPKYLNIQKYLPLFSPQDDASFLKISTFPYSIQDAYLSLKQYDFAVHSLILGASGTGKSMFLCSLISHLQKDEDFKSRYKILMIDPHAAMESVIGGLSNTMVIDFQSPKESIQLFSTSRVDILAETENYLSLFAMMMQENYNPKLERVLRFSFQLLLELQRFSFQNLRSLLTDNNYRLEILNAARGKVSFRVQDFFYHDFSELKVKSYGEAIAPILSFLDEMQSIPVFQEENVGIPLPDLLKENFLSLVSLDRTKLGDHLTKIISGFLMCQLLSFIGTGELKEHLLFVIDEVAVVENPILCRLLSEARKYGVSVILVGQYLNQVTEELKHAIFANVINYYTFRISYFDADLLVDHLSISGPNLKLREEQCKLLTHLSHREGIMRVQKNGKLLPGIKMSTLSFDAVPRQKNTSSLIEQKCEIEQQKFSFLMNPNVSLKEILKHLSTAHRKVR